MKRCILGFYIIKHKEKLLLICIMRHITGRIHLIVVCTSCQNPENTQQKSSKPPDFLMDYSYYIEGSLLMNTTLSKRTSTWLSNSYLEKSNLSDNIVKYWYSLLEGVVDCRNLSKAYFF